MKKLKNVEEQFFELLQDQLQEMAAVIDREIMSNVYHELIRKVCNTRIQEFISSTKQKMAAKKGLASAVGQNLRDGLLSQHTQLITKLRK